jgi:Domain of unknown function (DUF4126)
MDTTYDILQAIGLGLAFGLRPVFAPLAVALLAALHVGIDLRGTDFSDLASTPLLIALAVLALAWLAFEIGRGALHPAVHLVIAVVFAGAFGAGSVDEHSSAWWPGVIAGVAGAVLAWAALTPLLAGARQRLAGEKEAGIILPVLVELTAVITAFLSLVFPPLAVIALIAVVVLLVRGRRNRDGRYAGLRTLTK